MTATKIAKEKNLLLITGAAGFISSALVWHLNQLGFKDILVCDHLRSNDKWLNLRGLLFRDFVHPEKLLDYIECHGLIEHIKTIVHLGACSKTTETDMDYLFENNVVFSKKMFDLAKKADARFIYASSGATYGALERFDDNESPQNLRPLNKYGYSKNLFDQWMERELERDLKIDVLGLKFFNVFGPNEFHKEAMASVLFHAYQQYVKDGEVRLFKSVHKDYADGRQKRDFIYVKDVAKIIEKFMNISEVKSGLYNVGTGRSNTFYDFVSPIFSTLGVKENIRYIDMPPHLLGKYQYFTEANMHKTFMALGIDRDFFTPLPIAVKDYVENYLSRNEHLDHLVGERY